MQCTTIAHFMQSFNSEKMQFCCFPATHNFVKLQGFSPGPMGVLPTPHELDTKAQTARKNLNIF